nr:MAG TPA: hypothetical protein [Caudoviricetes sp.]
MYNNARCRTSFTKCRSGCDIWCDTFLARNICIIYV